MYINNLKQKSAPYCQEYGNKERVRCEWDDPDLAENVRNQTTLYDYDAISLPTYRGCSHVKRIERWKFIKFEVYIKNKCEIRLKKRGDSEQDMKEMVWMQKE